MKIISVYDSLQWKLESYVSLIMYVANVFYHDLCNFCPHADCFWKGRVFHLILFHIDGMLNFSRYVIVKSGIIFKTFSQDIPVQKSDVDCGIFCCQVS